MILDELLEYNGLSLDLLEQFSYKTQLNMSLKRTLRHFDKTQLLNEVFDYVDILDVFDISSQVSLDFRIKSYESIEAKYQRYFPNTQVFKTFNDILGFRAFCDSYNDLLSSTYESFRVIDMSNGKANDDGYRGVHIYYQKSNYHYPIEIQYNTLFDRQMNNWLHDYLYKKNYPLEYGRILRSKYEAGLIRNENDFVEVLNNDLLGG